jgi:myb proto-oncogene protein/Myb-like DNA-binding protein BAS1
LLERKKAAALRVGAQVVASSSASVTSSKDSSSPPSVVLPNDRTLTPPEQNRTLPSPAKSPPAPSSTRVALPVEEDPATETQTTNSSRSQSDSVVDMWPPYFPPEAYPIHGSSLSPSHSFQVPSPQLVPVSPNIAPFQFSSSSLSTALSAPPRLPRPLPPVSNEPPLMALELESDLFSSTGHTPSVEQLRENDDSLMSLDDPLLSTTTEAALPPMEHFTATLLPPVFTPPLLQQPISLHPSHPSIPISPPSHSTDMDQFQVSDIWKSPGPLIDFLAPLLEQSPQSNKDNNLQMDANFDDFSSTSSTPCLFSSSLSATSSPNVSSPVDLPGSEQSGSSTGSLLFSTSREPMRSFQPARSRRPIPNKLLKTGTPMRLSSSLPLTAEYAPYPPLYHTFNLILLQPFYQTVCVWY